MWAPRSPASARSTTSQPWTARRRTPASPSIRLSTPAKASFGRKARPSTWSASGPARSNITMTKSASAKTASTASRPRSRTTRRRPEAKSSSCRWQRHSARSLARSGLSSITSRSTRRATQEACSATRGPIAAPPISSTSCGSPKISARCSRAASKTSGSTARPAYSRRRWYHRRIIRRSSCNHSASCPRASASSCSRTCRRGWSQAPPCNASSARRPRSSFLPTARTTRPARSRSAIRT